VISIAARMGLSPDPFLIAVAIGASSDFLTPFGHHNNTIIMGPGGYRFGDFGRVGLGLELIVIAVSLVVIPIVWPFERPRHRGSRWSPTFVAPRTHTCDNLLFLHKISRDVL
jgi:Na+/H+ antiporter NhaD/arsenite permease-like protein